MRVLLTTDTVGGVWTFTRELATGLLRLGHAVALVSFGRLPDAEQQAWVRASERLGEFVYTASSVPLEWMQANADAMAGARVLADVAETFEPDLLHSNQFCYAACNGAPSLGTAPCLVTAHSDVLSWAAACKPAGLPQNAWLRQYRQLVQNGLEAADAIVAPTAWMLHALAANFTLPATRKVILNGRDIAHRAPVAKAMQAVTIGRLWDEAKGLAILAGLDAPLPIVIAGEVRGEDDAVPLPEGLTYAGRLPESELLLLFDRSALYLATSLYEPFGLAPLEAALCGCGVVANDLPSLREVWGEDALYFSGVAALEALLKHLQSDPDLLTRLQQRSMARARTLTGTYMTGQYLALYKSLLAGSKPKAEAGMAYAH